MTGLRIDNFLEFYFYQGWKTLTVGSSESFHKIVTSHIMEQKLARTFKANN
jgi:hypothetical protein